MRKLIVAEAMPQKVVRLFRVLRGFLILGCFVFLFIFVRKEKELLEEYREIRSFMERMTEYRRILEDAAASYTGGDLAASEGYYLQILSDSLSDVQPYLGLAEIYCDRRWYEKALEILRAYPEKIESSVISEKIKEIEEYVQILEQSQFIPVS